VPEGRRLGRRPGRFLNMLRLLKVTSPMSVGSVAGAAAERWSVFEAGFASARDPSYTVGPQRARIEAGLTRGGSRRGRTAARESGGAPPQPTHDGSRTHR
jgi:hypothetical protein